MGIPFPSFLLFLSSNHMEVSGAGWGGSYLKWLQIQMLPAAHLETRRIGTQFNSQYGDWDVLQALDDFPRAQHKIQMQSF